MLLRALPLRTSTMPGTRRWRICARPWARSAQSATLAFPRRNDATRRDHARSKVVARVVRLIEHQIFLHQERPWNEQDDIALQAHVHVPHWVLPEQGSEDFAVVCIVCKVVGVRHEHVKPATGETSRHEAGAPNALHKLELGRVHQERGVLDLRNHFLVDSHHV